MSQLQATWVDGGRLFFWAPGDLDAAVEREAPGVAGIDGQMVRRKLAGSSDPKRRDPMAGFEVEILDALRVLSALGPDADISDSLRCWSFAAKLALELAASQRVVPTVRNGEARWGVLLSRGRDRERIDRLVDALPVVNRAAPRNSRGNVRLATARTTVREFLDTAVDALYRQGGHPGSSRGWPLEFAVALKGTDNSSFRPREARNQGVPEMLTAWARDAEAGGLRLGVSLHLPDEDGGAQAFRVSYWLHPEGDTALRKPLEEAWDAGDSIELGGKSYPHPATSAIVGLARMARLYEPMMQSLQGRTPRPLRWIASQAWEFIAQGASLLEDAGFVVEMPEEFQGMGGRRIRARMRIDATGLDDGTLELSSLLRFRWEVVLGDKVLTGAQFAELLSHNRPVVEFEGSWVLLDPTEIAKLPKGLPQEGELPAAVALRAVLTGRLNDVEVVADDRLEMVLEALRQPPPVEPPQLLVGTLRAYQLTGLSWLTTLGQLGLGACLADDMGLGKTIQLIAHIAKRREGRTDRDPCLVVCPTSVLGNWRRECEKFAPSLKVVRYHGANRDPSVFDGADVVLTTYGLLVRDSEVLVEQSWDVLALDEAQGIKNPDSQRARVSRTFRARHRVAMTGTPVENRLDELWSLMEFLVPGLLGPRGTFRRNVAVPVERFGDQEVAHQLKLGVSPFLLRRLKSDPDIISDLPEKLESVDYCALRTEQARLYRQVVDDHLAEIQDTASGSGQAMSRRGRVLAMLTALKQVCNHPDQYLKNSLGELSGRSGKLDRLTELLDDILEIREQALIFTQYRQMGELLQRHIIETYEEDVPFLHGGVPPEKRDAMVDAFQSPEHRTPFLIVSLRAGGTGLNLTAATHVVHYDRWWNPAVEDQATDRAYRIGQSRNVQVHKMVSQGTLEERIDTMLQEKRELAESVVGSGEQWVTELDDDALRALVMLGEDAVEDDE